MKVTRECQKKILEDDPNPDIFFSSGRLTSFWVSWQENLKKKFEKTKVPLWGSTIEIGKVR